MEKDSAITTSSTRPPQRAKHKARTHNHANFNVWFLELFGVNWTVTGQSGVVIQGMLIGLGVVVVLAILAAVCL